MIKTEIKPEPLNGKIYISNAIDEDDIDPATKENVERRVSIDDKPLFIFKFRDVKSACEFWLRYSFNPKRLITEKPEFKNEVESFFSGEIKALNFITFVCMDLKDVEKIIDEQKKYNEWLFKLAFKDVLGGDKKSIRLKIK